MKGGEWFRIFRIKNKFMKKLFISLMLLVFIFGFSLPAFAHPGRTDRYGCHTCKTNCKKWGLRYNQYHCHRAK
jgi:hypothetical protein